MNKPTEKEVGAVIQELHEAMLENIEANEAVENSKLAKQKAYKRLTMAREELRAINFN